MKIAAIILISVLSAVLLSGNDYRIKTEKGNYTHFISVKKNTKSTQTKGIAYYQYGNTSRRYRFVTTGYLRVGFSDMSDMDRISTDYKIRAVRQTGSNRYLFINESGQEDMALCAGLSREASVAFAIPKFHGKKRLQ